MDQLNLFSLQPLQAPVNLREEERFGKWDAKCGLPLVNYYSSRISGERREAYERGFRKGIMQSATRMRAAPMRIASGL